MDDTDIYDDSTMNVFMFEECKKNHPDDHWQLNPICQHEGCGRPRSDWPHNDYGRLAKVQGNDNGEWHLFEPPPQPWVFGENAYRMNKCHSYVDHSHDTSWIIAGPLDPLDEERLYWSNEQGWVNRAEATPFDSREGNLPDEATGWEQGNYTRKPDDKCDCRCHWGQFYVNVYEVDRAWGGAEEGGWWYDTGEPIASVPFDTLREAETFRDVMEARFPHNRSSSSVIYSGGDYCVYIEHKFARPYPDRRPHYE